VWFVPVPAITRARLPTVSTTTRYRSSFSESSGSGGVEVDGAVGRERCDHRGHEGAERKGA
jgi:hypothetical protein